MKPMLYSKIPGFEGPCDWTWLNGNVIDMRYQNISGITGFFKLVKKHWLFGWIKYGKEFHGYIDKENNVKSTEGIY